MSVLVHTSIPKRQLIAGVVSCVVAGLAFGITIPAAAASFAVPIGTDAGADAAPVTVLQLTSSQGEVTPIAREGLERLAEGGQEAGTSAMSLPTSSDAVAPETVQVLSAPLQTDEFLVAGLTWQGEEVLPEGTEAFLRVLEDDAWSPWLPLEQEISEKDEETNIGGTEPFLTGGATAVQVRVATAQGAQLPADLQLNLVPSVVEGSERGLADAPSAATQLASLSGETEQAAVARPAIISRSGWGADESKMTWTPSQNDIRAAVVHHTAGTNNYSKDQSAGVVRGIYHYHAVTRGWGDIGYNFLFDKYGQIFEGRAGSLWSPSGKIPTGAHAAGYNAGTVGVSAMGDYSTVWAPQIILDNMAKVIAWKFSGAGINATSASGIIAPGTNFTAQGVNLPRIFGHRDVANVTRTTCPGPNIGGRLGDMRTAVASLTRAGGSVSSSGGASAATPPMWYLNNNFDSSSDLQFAWGQHDDEHLIGDWNGDAA